MLKFRKLLPLFNRVLIEKAQPITKTRAGILLSEKDAPKVYGTVIAVGPGKLLEGKHVPVNVKVGQKVLLPEYGGSTFKLGDDKEYALYKDDDILGVLEDEEN